jgi:hypothetical protein
MAFCEHGEEQLGRWPAELMPAAQGLCCMELDSLYNVYQLLYMIVLFVILFVSCSFIFFFICNGCL